jgi:hypothetical protein
MLTGCSIFAMGRVKIEIKQHVSCFVIFCDNFMNATLILSLDAVLMGYSKANCDIIAGDGSPCTSLKTDKIKACINLLIWNFLRLETRVTHEGVCMFEVSFASTYKMLAQRNPRQNLLS